MTTIALVGAGAVGTRAARQLVDTPGIKRLLIADRSRAQARDLADRVGGEAVSLSADGLMGANAVALTIPSSAAARLAKKIISTGVPVATATDDETGTAALFALNGLAKKNSTQILVGCALLPGLGDVLARHGANALARADEVQAARVGAAGPTCAASVRRSRREPAREWSDGEWHTSHRSGAQLVWFPEPIGEQVCEQVSLGVENLRRAVPEATFVLSRAGEAPPRRSSFSFRGRRETGDLGAGVRIEVLGWQGSARASIVYGAVEHPAAAAATVLAIATARLAGLLPAVKLKQTKPGAWSLGEAVDPTSFLAELAERGVRVAVFEGVAGSR